MAKVKPKKGEQPTISMGGIVRENLPFPFVHYPYHYGTFFAFSETPKSESFLCECSQAAIANYIELRTKAAEQLKFEYIDDGKRIGEGDHLDKLHLPNSIRDLSISEGNNLAQNPHFTRGICHRCNLVPPTMRYCHEMYGVRFIQHFGWYVKQAYLKFGILPRTTIYLKDVTPGEFIQDLDSIRNAQDELNDAMMWFRVRDEQLRLHLGNHALPVPAFDAQEIACHQDIRREATKKARQAERCLSEKIENIVREEFGFRKVGERWTSETLVYRIVCNLFPNIEIIKHHRPAWLRGLELDIYLPSYKVAFEYQGQQHFHPIKAWGGEKSLKELQERDKRKKEICRDAGIHLISIDYTEPLTQEHIEALIKEIQGDRLGIF